MKQQREHWGSKFGFILAAAGSAIGIGSVWLFPYTVGSNGGGAFVLLYILFTLLIGLPLFISELIVGRHAQKSAVFAYADLSNGKSNWKMLGWVNIISCFIILSYYSVVAGWCLSYVLMSLTQFSLGKTPEQIQQVFTILADSADISLFWLFFFLALTAGVVYSGVRKGIEYWSKILTPLLLFMLLGLFAFSFTLSGFKPALKFLFYPDFSKLGPSGVLNALGLSFFTLSVGLGIILTYGSYMKPQENIPKNGVIVSIMTMLVSIIAGMVVFPIVFSFGFTPQAGPGLVFKTMPVLFAKLPGSLVISTVFFALLVFTALTSSISLLEMLVANLIEVFHWTRAKSCIIAAIVAFILGVPSALTGANTLFPNWKSIYRMDFFETMGFITNSWLMPIAGLMTTIFAGWYLKKSFTKDEFLKGSKAKAFFYHLWIFSTRYICPVAIVVIVLQEAKIVDFISLFSSSK